MAVWKDKQQFQKTEDSYPQWLLFLIENGSIEYQFGNYQGVATTGDFILCPPDTTFHRVMIAPASFIVFNMKWRNDSGTEIRLETELVPNPTGKHAIQDSQRLSTTYKYLKILAERFDRVSLLRKQMLLRDIWVLYSLEFETLTLWKSAQKDDPLMQIAEKRLRELALTPFRLKMLSHELGLSSLQFGRRFKAIYGHTPTEYLMDIRLQHAKYMLLETKLNLNEIAEQCGYDNGFYLSRVFAKNLHSSPSEFRKRHRL